MKIHLIRHGKTTANEQKLYCGITDIGLCKNGIDELYKLRKSITYPLGELYCTSGLKRTNETLEFIYNKKPNFVLEDFQEFNFGDFEMKSYEELKDNSEYQNWLNDYENYVLPKGESKAIFENRVLNGYKKLLEFQCDVVLVCHGGVIATIMNSVFRNEKNFYEWQPSYARGYTIEVDEKWIKYWQL